MARVSTDLTNVVLSRLFFILLILGIAISFSDIGGLLGQFIVIVHVLFLGIAIFSDYYYDDMPSYTPHSPSDTSHAVYWPTTFLTVNEKERAAQTLEEIFLATGRREKDDPQYFPKLFSVRWFLSKKTYVEKIKQFLKQGRFF